MTSFHGLPSKKKKKEAISLPSPCFCLFSPVPLSLSLLCPFMHPLFCFSSGFHIHTSLILSPSVLLLLEEAAGLLSAETGATQSFGCMLKRGRRGVAFGCVEVCVNSQSFNQRSLGACGHGYTVISFTFIYACYLLSGRRSDVAVPRKCVHKKHRSLPKGLRSLRMVFLLTGGVRLFMGR